MNIPIYRAKKTDSDKYVIGYLLPEYKGKFYLSIEWSRDFDGDTPDFVQIDISTLSIHFPDMIDSQGNKIFASLSEDGKGGDIAKYSNQGHWIAIYIENAFMWVNVLDMQKIGTKQPVSFLRLKPLAKMIVIGIQE